MRAELYHRDASLASRATLASARGAQVCDGSGLLCGTPRAQGGGMTRTQLIALILAATACQGGAAIGPTDGESHENLLVAGATYSDLRALENAFPIPAT